MARTTRAPVNPKRKSRAASADRHELYEQAVQDPPSEVEFVSKTFRKLRGRKPLRIREDFCGTAAFSQQWVRSGKQHEAWGIDLDEETLRWTREKRVCNLSAHQRDRLHLRKADVLNHCAPPVEVAVAFNFSYWTFKTRAELLKYFRHCYKRLAEDGIFFLDVLGGLEIAQADETVTRLKGFTYVWEHASFNPITHDFLCHIHFKFSDGSTISPAFTYDWRLWSLPELRELLKEAGFSKTRVYWEDEDEDGEETGQFSEVASVENQATWWAYLVAQK